MIPDDAGAAAGPALARTFWRLVLVLNAGLLAAAIGLMLVGFRGEVSLGGGLTLVGLATLAYGVYGYRRVRSGERVASNRPDP